MADSPWDAVTVWHELMSLEPERARKFYEEVLGLKTVPWRARHFPTHYGCRGRIQLAA